MNNYNISTRFLLPGIEIDPNLKKEFKTFGFINTYLICEPYTYPFETVYLLFKPSNFDLEFSQFITQLQKNRNFIEIIDLMGKILLVYRVPKKFKLDYRRFLKGEYSKLSPEFQKCFVMEEYKRNSDGTLAKDERNRPILQPTLYHHVFQRTLYAKESLKNRLELDEDDTSLDDMELYDIQDPEKESYPIFNEVW